MDQMTVIVLAAVLLAVLTYVYPRQMIGMVCGVARSIVSALVDGIALLFAWA